MLSSRGLKALHRSGKRVSHRNLSRASRPFRNDDAVARRLENVFPAGWCHFHGEWLGVVCGVPVWVTGEPSGWLAGTADHTHFETGQDCEQTFRKLLAQILKGVKRGPEK